MSKRDFWLGFPTIDECDRTYRSQGEVKLPNRMTSKVTSPSRLVASGVVVKKLINCESGSQSASEYCLLNYFLLFSLFIKSKKTLENSTKIE